MSILQSICPCFFPLGSSSYQYQTPNKLEDIDEYNISHNKYDYVFKLLLIGDSGVGKSNILQCFIDENFHFDQNHPTMGTIGVNLGSRYVEINNKRIKLSILDTAGAARFQSVTKTYYKGALGAIVVYDITNRNSFLHLEKWLHDIRDLSSMDISIVLVGHKIDLYEEREIDILEASNFALENDVLHFETSVITKLGVDQAFFSISQKILSKIENNEIDPSSVTPYNKSSNSIDSTCNLI